MNINLNEKLTDVITSHRTNDEQCRKSMQEVVNHWQAPSTISMYTAEHIQTAIQNELDSVIAESHKVDIVLNQKLKAIISETKSEVLPFLDTTSKKPSDYAIKINNALQFLKLEGDKISDEKAYKILKPFINDFEQMDLFSDIVEKQVGTANFINAYGECSFEKTFGTTNRIRSLLNLFNDAESIAETLFLLPKVDGEYFIINNQRFVIKQDGYSEVSDENDIISIGDAITEIVKDMAAPVVQEI